MDKNNFNGHDTTKAYSSHKIGVNFSTSDLGNDHGRISFETELLPRHFLDLLADICQHNTPGQN